MVGLGIALCVLATLLTLKDAVHVAGDRVTGRLHVRNGLVTTLPEARPEIPLASPDFRAGHSIAGWVHDESGIPLQGAWVLLTDGTRDYVNIAVAVDARLVVQTDSRGRFAFDGDPPVQGEIWIRRPEYIPARVSCRGLTSEDLKGLEVTLRQGGAIGGSVHTFDGTPVAGATVLARGAGADGEAVRDGVFASPRVERSRCRTDVDGQFNLIGLADHSYMVDVFASSLRRIQPTGIGEMVIASPGETIAFKVEPIGLVHAIAVDDTSGAIITSAVWDYSAADVMARGFVPWSTRATENKKFVAGGLSGDLAMLGFDIELLSKGSRGAGRLLMDGLVHSWPVDGTASVPFIARARGYLDEPAEIPVVPADPEDLPQSTTVRMRRDPDYPGEGSVRLLVRPSPEQELRPGRRYLRLWMHRGGVRHPLDEQSATVKTAMREFEFGSIRMRGHSDGQNRELTRRHRLAMERRRRENLEEVHVTTVIDESGIGVLEGLEAGTYSFMDFSELNASSFEVIAGAVTDVDAVEVKDPFEWPDVRRYPIVLAVREAVTMRPISGYGYSIERTSAGPDTVYRFQLPVGSTYACPDRRLSLESGTHSIRVFRPGYRDCTVTVTLTAGEAGKKVEVHMVRERPW